MEKDDFFDKDYIKEDVILRVLRGHIFGFILIFTSLIIFGVPFYLLWLKDLVRLSNPTTQERLMLFVRNSVPIIATGLLVIVLYVMIQVFLAAIFAKDKFKSVKFGIMPARKLFSPYCHCKEKLRINHYRMVTIMPFIIMGIIPAVISLITGNILLNIFGIISIAGSCIDILLFLKTLKGKKDSWVLDSYPTELGFCIYRKK